ncbi:hypothetical protein V1514DRAFT_337382 [Lipomyces japonicus]|uniref:uncharacterized protein n=1 Tax=Lipomyces japonicus TaxID=56871 RepID=UPI0034CE2672
MVNEVKTVTPLVSQEPVQEKVSKRERHRKNKANRIAESANGDGLAKNEATAESESSIALSQEEIKNPYIEYISKRIRNLQKRKQRLDKIEEQAGSSDAAKLNADQLEALKSKDQVIAPLKELEELLKSFKVYDEEGQNRKAIEQKNKAAEIKVAVAKARTQAFLEARENIAVLVKFLHVASWKRQFDSTVSSETESTTFETLLGLIYGGDDAAVDAIEKLTTGSDELVGENVTEQKALSYSKIKQISVESIDELYAKYQESEAKDASFAAIETDQHDILIRKSADDVDHDDDDDDNDGLINNNVIKVPKGGIQFLNESELEPVPPPEATTFDFAKSPATIPAVAQTDDAHANHAGASTWDTKVISSVAPIAPAAAAASALEASQVVSSTSGQKHDHGKSKQKFNKQGGQHASGQQQQQSQQSQQRRRGNYKNRRQAGQNVAAATATTSATAQ